MPISVIKISPNDIPSLVSTLSLFVAMAKKPMKIRSYNNQILLEHKYFKLNEKYIIFINQ